MQFKQVSCALTRDDLLSMLHACASYTSTTTSAAAAAACERATPMRSTASEAARRPAVSSSVTATPLTSRPAGMDPNEG